MLGDRMAAFLDEYLRLVATARYVQIEDVTTIRTVLDEEVVIDEDIIGKLLELDRAVIGSPHWNAFLAETVANFADASRRSTAKIHAMLANNPRSAHRRA
jgi:hypothetical protein